MPERLDIAAGIDTTGLDSGTLDIIAKIDGIAKAVNAIPPAQFHLDTTGLDADVAQAIAKIEVLAEAIRTADLGSFDKSQFLGGLADELAVDAQAFKATSAEAAALDDLLRHLRAESEALRSAGPILPPSAGGGGGGPPNNPPVDQFAAFRREAAATSGVVSELTATMALGNKGNLDYAAGLAVTEAQLRTEKAELAETARRTAQYAEASRQASLSPMAQGLENVRLTGIGLRDELGKGAAALETHAFGARRATNAIAQLAATSIGAEGPVARLAESVLLFGGGEIAIVGVAAAVLAVAEAYNFLNTKQREADERNQKLLSGLRSQVEQLSATEAATLGLAAAIEAEAKARESLASKIAGPAAKVLSIITDPLATGISIGVEVKRRQEESITHAIEEQRQARKNLADLELQSITQALQLHVATNEQQKRGADLARDLTSQLSHSVIPLERQLELRQKLETLAAAAFDRESVNANLSRTAGAASDVTAAQQQEFTAQEAALRAHQAIEQVITQQGLGEQLEANRTFFESLRGIRERQAAADEAFLRSEVQRTDVKLQDPTLSPAERTNLGAQLDHLQAQIALRERILAQQVAQLKNDEALAQLPLVGRVLDSPSTVAIKPRIDAGELRASLEQEIGSALQGIKDDATQIDFQKAEDSANQLFDVLQGVTMDLKDIGNANITTPIDKAVDSAQQLADAFLSVAQGIDGLRAIGDQLGVLDERADKALKGVSDLSEGVSKIAKGDVLGGIIEGIQGAIGVIQGVFGKSADQKAAEQALHENTAAIREETIRRSEGFQGIGGASQAADILRREIASTSGQALIPNTQEGGDTGRAARNALVDDLSKLGLSFVDLQRLAQDFGITILEKGKLVGGSLEQLAQEIENSIAAQLRFTDSFADQLQKETLGSRLRGEPQDATSQFAREVKAAGSSGATAITDAFKGIKDLGDTPAVRQALVDLFNKFSAGTLDPATLGTLSRDEFLQFLDDGAGFLDTFNQGLQDAGKKLQGVPDFFKLGEAEFQARGLGGTDGSKLPPVTLPPIAFTPRPLTPGPEFIPSLAQAAPVKQAITQNFRDVILQFPTTPQNPAELIKAVQTGAIQIALSRASGNTDNPGLG